jgi:uncharacterized protein with ParB-like and HNH nuclease domain
MSDIKQARSTNAKWYFLSTIVLAVDEKQKDKHYIVDGQQRLTTLTILLAVVRHYLPENEKILLEEAIKGKDNPFLNQYGNYRLNLYHERDFFRTYIQLDGGIQKAFDLLANTEEYEKCTDTQKRLLQCVANITKKLKKTGRDVDIADASQLARYVLNY